jgi:hypothetical protein
MERGDQSGSDRLATLKSAFERNVSGAAASFVESANPNANGLTVREFFGCGQFSPEA